MSDDRGEIMQRLATVFAATLILAPLGAEGADLVVWWEKGFYPQEDEAIREIIAAFEQETGKEVELVRPTQDQIVGQAEATLEAGHPPDFLFSTTGSRSYAHWAHAGWLADLRDVLGRRQDLFDPDAIEAATFVNGKNGERSLYALPMGRQSNHLHVWQSLLRQAGFSLADVPRGWEAFWPFWCDEVQPSLRQALGREDVWGVGLPMSIEAVTDTWDELVQFQIAYETPWVSSDGLLRVDDPVVRAGMIRALEDYSDIWLKGCTPPDSVSWTNIDNNKAFLEQTVVMTANTTLSIPSALKQKRPDDYYENAVTIEWPHGANGQSLVILGAIARAVVFEGGHNRALADDFVRFLVDEGWLAHWLTFAGDRYLPPMRKLTDQPFWLDPSDPHRMRAAIQTLTQPHHSTYAVRDKEWQSNQLRRENVWGKAVHRVAVDGISPEQAVDEAIARIKQILSE
jgi:multiple sugar transport system substrate-binding protein